MSAILRHNVGTRDVYEYQGPTTFCISELGFQFFEYVKVLMFWDMIAGDEVNDDYSEVLT